MSSSRAVHHFVSPEREVNAGIWSLFGGATVVLLTADIFISYEFATGYVVKTWNDRMLILVSISSCLTTAGQTWSKSAFAVTLLRMTNNWQKFICVATLIILNVFLVLKVFVDWSKYCGKSGYQNWWRMPGFCVDYQAAANIKVGGNIFNIVADFVLALFPWMVTWKLRISLKEKIALCITMSLGVVVAIISAVRTAWMEDPSVDAYNDYYFWRQGLSMVWYSAEVAGTIIVQSIPLMRPLVNDMHTSLASKKLGSGADGKSYGPGKSSKSTNRRTLTLILQGCDVKDDENDVEDQKRVDVDRMHLTQDENGKIVLRRRTDSGEDVNAYQNSRVTNSTRRLEEEEIGLTEDQKDRMVVSSEYHANGGSLEDIPEYHAHGGPLEEIPEYHAHGRPLEEIPEYHPHGESLEEIPEYRTIGGKEHIPMTEFHAVTC
ncbi:uncharacterized protein Bfra_005345 [Botrytis fragariae]|uniref:Rhodopsin domain-containing protein n=1 Tax=Botrytis fragariae TaxID=1964551 RepID=A0A8H6AU79_9HELO|nr:uncharacterized protein Bfra_005345 [Botrytis fragariae]KAF5873878.1 hypothetical protein Bfra_005345 [Botrytis fragariae]